MGMLKVVSHHPSSSIVHTPSSTSRGVDWIRKARQSTFAEALQTVFQSLPTSVNDLGDRCRVKSLTKHSPAGPPALHQNPQSSKLQNWLARCLYLYADMAHMATTAANTVLTPLGRHDSLDSLLQIGIILAADAEAGIGNNAGEE
ncbi:hypothetical protein K439DRAFT_1626811 [Ramaria rubella]|nr:hypothetical protein K439DRAFT_1626811 [Ramaria rubella]